MDAGPRSVRETALIARSLGLAVVPPTEDGIKKPLGSWRQYQEVPPSEEQIHEWYPEATATNTGWLQSHGFGNGKRHGLGFICGAVSGNLETLDIDGETLDESESLHRNFLAALQERDVDLCEKLQGYCEKSPSGGVHWLYRTEATTVQGNQKLATRPATDDELQKAPKARIKTLIETRGEGGYIVVAPSHGPVHDSGRPYETVSGSLETIPVMTAKEVSTLHEVAVSFHVPTPANYGSCSCSGPCSGSCSGSESTGEPGYHGLEKLRANKLVQKWNDSHTWNDMLEEAGWSLVSDGGAVGESHWRRPGKEIGTSATTNYRGSDMFVCFTSSCEFEQSSDEARYTYTKFEAWTVLNFDGNGEAALETLKETHFFPLTEWASYINQHGGVAALEALTDELWGLLGELTEFQRQGYIRSLKRGGVGFRASTDDIRAFQGELRRRAEAAPPEDDAPGAEAPLWESVDNHGTRHGLWRRLGEQVRVLDDAIRILNVLVVRGVVERIDIEVEPSIAGRTKRIQVPTAAISNKNPAEEIRKATNFAWTPSEGEVVRDYLAWFLKNCNDDIRRPAYKKPGWYTTKDSSTGIETSRLCVPGFEREDDPVYIGPEGLRNYGHCCITQGESDFTEDQAPNILSAIYETAVGSGSDFEGSCPKFGMILGAVIVSPFLEKLDREGFTVHGVGDSTQGKTISCRCAMSMFGCPKDLEHIWNATSTGAGEQVSSNGVLPLFLDETGAANARYADELFKETVFRTSSGVGRTRSGQSGGVVEKDPASKLVLLSTGERRLTTSGSETGLRARVLELNAPMFPDALTADSTYDAAMSIHGWLGQQLIQNDGLFLEQLTEVLPMIEGRLREATTDSIVKRLAGPVALCGAGLTIAGLLSGHEPGEVFESVIAACLTIINECSFDLEQAGVSVAGRLYTAILESTVSHSHLWAFRQEHNGAPTGGAGEFHSRAMASGEIYGLREGGLLWVLTGGLDKIAASVGIKDPLPAVRKLLEDGLLEPGPKGRLQKQKKFTLQNKEAVLTRFYCFKTGLDYKE